jgi:hypothetical protein
MKKVFLILVITSIQLFSQPFSFTRSSRVVLFPDFKLFPSNFSDPYEAKIGSQFYLDDKNLELNIGTAKDLVHYGISPLNRLAFGIEFFNWTLLNRKSQFRFPVVAADYFFGGYFVFHHKGRRLDWVNRLRFSHISAHLSDGYYDKNQNAWIDNKLPFTYSREFVQWTSAFVHRNLKLYFDAIYLFHSIPEWRYNTIAGVGSEVIVIAFPKIATKFFSGFDLKFQKVSSNKFESNKSFSAGFILGNQNLSHLRVAYQFYSGYNIHGQFFNAKLNQSYINISLII